MLLHTFMSTVHCQRTTLRNESSDFHVMFHPTALFLVCLIVNARYHILAFR